jgi:UDP-3-O-[3-hydroxymyristoyl] glucosamine N-acyltransferase
MAVRVADVAALAGGVLEGNGDAQVTGLAGLREAGPSDVSFLGSSRYEHVMSSTKAAAVLVSLAWRGESPCPVIRVDSPEQAFAKVAAALAPPVPEPARGVHPTAVVALDARLGRDVRIGPWCVIEPGVFVGDRTVLGAFCYLGHGTTVGEDCRLYPHVSVREWTRIGSRTIIHNGAVIGSDGFGYERDGRRWKKIPQRGVVAIGDDVEIGANVTVDRARFGRTVIGNGVKIDNLVQIAHNVVVGDDTAMAAQVGISGSTIVGRGVQLGGQAGTAGHIVVGDSAIVAARAGVTKDVAPGTMVSGYPAMPHDKARKLHAHLARLPALKEKVEELERRLAALEKGVPGGAGGGAA